jgi:hypothetical protein
MYKGLFSLCCPVHVRAFLLADPPSNGFYQIRLISERADWTFTDTSHKDTEHVIIKASITLDEIPLTDSLIR